VADVPKSNVDPQIAERVPDPPPTGRRLWERFSLSVLSLLVLLLAQASFGILVQDYSRTFEVAAGPLAAYLLFGIAAGFAAGMAVVLPRRLAFRHPRRGITLALVPMVVTVLNVTVAIAPAALPNAIGVFTTTNLIGVQGVASLLLGVAAAATTSES
jgi:hypothetical protein